MNEEINNIRDFIKHLCQEEVVSFLEKTSLEKAGGKIFLVFPQLSYRQKDLHFYVEDSKKLSLLEGAEVTCTIQDKLGYDFTSDDIGNKIEVTFQSRLRKDGDKTAFLDRVPLTVQALKDKSIEQFLARNYPYTLSAVQPRTTERKNSDEENVEQTEKFAALRHDLQKAAETGIEALQKINQKCRSENPRERQFSQTEIVALKESLNDALKLLEGISTPSSQLNSTKRK
ncbi:MAG: hypothetical protein SFW07_06545 [Gammaproteobacteria bacterium]|nr:hypothetical protein [Gammaproteobacteria bacterium]